MADEQTTLTKEEVPPEEERFEIELPEDLLSSTEGEETPDEGPAPEGAEIPEERPVEEAAPPKKRMVEKAALDAERARRKEAVKRFEEAEEGRRRYEAEVLAYRAQQARAQQFKDVPLGNYDDKPTLTEAIKDYHESVVVPFVQTRVMALQQQAEQQALVERVARTQAQMVQEKPDYYEVLKNSGVQEAIAIDPQTGQWRDGFLARFLYSQPDPARAAYDYGRGRLASTNTAEAETRGERRGRREVVQKLLANEAKPKGIASLPSSGTASTGLTRREIDKLSDAQKRTLFAARPDLEQWWLGG